MSFSNLKRILKTVIFNQFAANFDDLNEKYSDFYFAGKPKTGLYTKKYKQLFKQYFQTNIQNTEYIYTEKFIDNLSDLIIDFMLLSYKISNADWEAK